MSLSSLQLDAFLAVARSGSFSEAAARLGLTQSALSQRVLNLESELERTLFIRESAGTRLSEEGETLLRYAQAKESMEAEMLQQLKAGETRGQVSGLLRVAGFSTVVRSLVLPKLGALGRKHPGLRFELLTRELREIPELLRSGRVDLALSTQPLERAGYESVHIGWEENVLIEAAGAGRSANARMSVFLDHDEDDTTTRDFWKLQKKAPKSYERAYFDEAYALVDAVAQGLGRAVVPKHWLTEAKGVRQVAGLKALKVPVFLLRAARTYRPQAHEIVYENLFGIFANAS
jgi:DNA-binding transcriptional LysR family regulator